MNSIEDKDTTLKTFALTYSPFKVNIQKPFFTQGSMLQSSLDCFLVHIRQVLSIHSPSPKYFQQ